MSVQSPPLAEEWEASLGPFPAASHVGGEGAGLRKIVQIPDGPQAQFSGQRSVTHGTLAPTWPNPGSQGSVVESLVSLRLEGSIQETWGLVPILSPKHQEMTAGLLKAAVGLPAAIGLFVSRAPWCSPAV